MTDTPAPENKICPEAPNYQQQAAEYLSGWQRERADFQNFKKEQQRKQGELTLYAKADLLKEVLKIADYLQSARQHLPAEQQASSWGQGILQVERELQRLLEEQGVTRIASVGQPFDPRLHEPLAELPTAEHPPGTVVSELQAGYLLHDILLRPAKVHVATAPAAEQPLATK